MTHTIPLSHLYLSLKCIVTRFSLELSPFPGIHNTYVPESHQFHEIAHRDSIVAAPLPPISLECWLNNWSFHTFLKPLVVAYNVIFLADFENDTTVCQSWKRLQCLRCILRYGNAHASPFCFLMKTLLCGADASSPAQFCLLCDLGPRVKHEYT